MAANPVKVADPKLCRRCGLVEVVGICAGCAGEAEAAVRATMAHRRHPNRHQVEARDSVATDLGYNQALVDVDPLERLAAAVEAEATARPLVETLAEQIAEHEHEPPPPDPNTSARLAEARALLER